MRFTALLNAFAHVGACACDSTPLQKGPDTITRSGKTICLMHKILTDNNKGELGSRTML